MDNTKDSCAEKVKDQRIAHQDGRGSKKGSKAGKGQGGERGGGGGDQGAKREKDISRALSRLLRHQALNAGIKLDKEGYAPLDKVLQWGPLRTLNISVQEIIDVTASNDKQRYSMRSVHPEEEEAKSSSSTNSKDDASYWLIRANQGHSIPLDSSSLLKPIVLEQPDSIPPVVVHGTYFAFWPAVVASGGLRRMGRNHVHCSIGLPPASGKSSQAAVKSPQDNTDAVDVDVDVDGKESDEAGASAGAIAATPTVISGMRTDAELLVYIDVRRSLEDGAMAWWMSDNGVVLTEGAGEDGLVPAKYFKEVIGRKENVGLLWKDGEKVADLPEGVRGRPPPAKSGNRGRGGGRGGRGGKCRGRGA
ncbi:KptA family-domain-containing protein [Coniella lustricola]|uniref:2'-phosphotransferase n=1 Tax=Coniella lustricola TaxID=2025994 RepID=A0A2T3AET4_9PEZI|nr:KptA family-domain-containing protein [Coniella lustricola]